MNPNRALSPGFCLGVALLLLSGCGARPSPPPASTGEAEPPAVSAVQLQGSVVRVVDPEGRWEFEAHSQHVEAEGLEGPYLLQPAEGRYQHQGKPPVFMRADRGRVDRLTERVALEGSVLLSSEVWELEADAVEYDLDAGEVVASGETKLSFGEGPADSPGTSPTQ